MKYKSSLKVAILTTRGLPARYGAFEQTVDQLVKYASIDSNKYIFYVACSNDAAQHDYEQNNVIRKFYNRKNGIGVLYYGLKSFFDFYFVGVRTFICFGYGLSPFFILFKLLGCKVICNVDGFEWRREKWGLIAKKYFKICEYLAAKSNSHLIFDSLGVARYYSIKYRRYGDIVFYGTEKTINPSLSDFYRELSSLNYFVVVMRMEPENHIYDIVNGFLLSNRKETLLLIGPETNYFLKKILPMIHLSNGRIKWLGPIYERANLLAIRKLAIAYIHGHSVGGTNPTLVEACSIGRPIFAYNSIFNKEVLGNNALYFSNSRELSIALDDKFDSNLTPPILCEKYTWPYVASKYFDILDSP